MYQVLLLRSRPVGCRTHMSWFHTPQDSRPDMYTAGPDPHHGHPPLSAQNAGHRPCAKALRPCLSVNASLPASSLPGERSVKREPTGHVTDVRFLDTDVAQVCGTSKASPYV
jgi:hypothetical protein